ncbi:MAG: ankyrin repeat domain-containing protein [Candidatus Cohnella colombiensis]|uniref:Ankyrin repeat domain-containing protein n=1 Tax=Candidatus Cohnella colombiensis TaxID=3121368 RepID=A0AA95ET28_9BACL|nr:MAG: ankyrin repeat domain-containing protein [Cohnella sp.]
MAVNTPLILVITLLLLAVSVIIISIVAMVNIRKQHSSQEQEAIIKATPIETTVNRIGQAVVSFILSLLSILIFLVMFKGMLKVSDRIGNGLEINSNTPKFYAVFFCIFLLVYLSSFILGVRAMKSVSGRGLAVASITLNTLLLVIILLITLLSVWFMRQTFDDHNAIASKSPSSFSNNSTSSSEFMATQQQTDRCDIDYYKMAIGDRNMTVIKDCLESGVNPDITNDEGLTAIASAATKDEIDIIKLALSKGANPDVRTKNSWNTLFYATSDNKVEIVKVLLENGANPNSKDKYNYTPLHIATIGDIKLESAELLLQFGANPNIQDNQGNTPLMYAASSGSMDLVSLLLSHGADTIFTNNDGLTVHDFADRSVAEYIYEQEGLMYD